MRNGNYIAIHNMKICQTWKYKTNENISLFFIGHILENEHEFQEAWAYPESLT